MKVEINKLKVFISLALVAIAMAFAMPRGARFSYEYKLGAEWEYEDFYADMSFPLLKTPQQIQEDLLSQKSALVPYFRYDEYVTNNSLRKAASSNLGVHGTEILAMMQGILERGVTSDDSKSYLTGSEVVYVQRGKSALKCPSDEIWIQSSARNKLLADVMQVYEHNADSMLQANGIYDLIEVNLVFDDKTTNLINSESQNLSPTSGYVSNGSLIVRKGEIVTPEIAQMLDSLREEKKHLGLMESEAAVLIGNILIAIIIVVLLYFVIYYTNPTVFKDSRFFYILTVFLLFAIGTLIAVQHRQQVFLFVPYTLAALYLQAFFKERLIIPVYTICLIPLLLFADNGACYFLMYLLAGIVATSCMKHMQKVWMHFVLATIIFAVLSISYAAMLMLNFMEESQWSLVLVRLLAASVFVVAGYPLISLFEKMFNLVSNARLKELTDTSNSLLRQLEQKAPGTFQHSLQVMNMADAAARAVDANPLLVRAGALYHDIGKISNPQCFVENESLLSKNEADKYHFGLTPQQSAHDIIRHMTDGVELAKKEHLPRVIIDFILSHHGTSLVSYFYNKSFNNNEQPREEDFRYPGKKPVTKEEVILMLCDTLEAASRSLSDYSTEACSAFVEKIFKAKMDDRQFDAVEMTLGELQELKEALKTYLVQMHHERIAYPDKRNRLSKQDKSI